MQSDCCSGLTGPWLYGTADFLSPHSHEVRGFLLIRKTAIVGVWRRPVADVMKCLFHATCHRRNIGFCWCEAVTWVFLFVCFFSHAWSFSRPSLLRIPRKVSGWRCLTTLWKCVSCVSSALSAGGAYTMNSFTWGVGGQTGWGVVMLIWHTWNAQAICWSVSWSGLVCQGISGEPRGEKHDAKAWICLSSRLPPSPRKGQHRQMQ